MDLRCISLTWSITQSVFVLQYLTTAPKICFKTGCESALWQWVTYHSVQVFHRHRLSQLTLTLLLPPKEKVYSLTVCSLSRLFHMCAEWWKTIHTDHQIESPLIFSITSIVNVGEAHIAPVMLNNSLLWIWFSYSLDIICWPSIHTLPWVL